MNILIIEDEALSARRLKTMVTELDPSFRVIDVTESVQTSVAWLRSHPAPDLILMDIELTDGKSFDIFDRVPVTSPVIFVTAYDEYAIRAFRVNSVDYLLKPVKQEELARSVEKLRQMQQAFGRSTIDIQSLVQTLQNPARYRERFLVRQGDRMIPVDTQDIAYIQSKDKVNTIYTFRNESYSIDQSLEDIEQTLDPKQFFRANRQYIVNADAVEKVHFWFSSKLKVEVKPRSQEDIIVSREKAMAFKSWLGG